MDEFIKSFNLTGVGFRFLVNGKTKTNSWKSGMLNIFFMLVCITYTISNFSYYFNRSFSEKYSQSNYESNPIIDMNNLSDFMLAFCQASTNNGTERDSIAMSAVDSTLQWHYYTRNPWLIENKIMINLTSCKKEDFPSFVSETYTIKLFENCLCAPSSALKDYNISYFFTDSYASYFYYKLFFKNSVVNNATALKYYSDYYRNNSQRLFTYFIDNQGNVDEDNGIPLSSYLNYDFTFLSPDVSQFSELFFSELEVNKDDNFFINKPNIYKGLTLDRVIHASALNVNQYNPNNPNMLNVRLRASNRRNTLFKSTMKFDLFLSKLISMILLMYIVFSFFFKIMNVFELKKVLIADLFKNFEMKIIMTQKLKLINEHYNETQIKKGKDLFKEEDDNYKIKTEKQTSSDVLKYLENRSQRMSKNFKFKTIVENSERKIEFTTQKTNENNRNDNDPINFDKLHLDIENDEMREKRNKEISEMTFGYSLTDLLCKTCELSSSKRLILKKKKEYFNNACSLIDYYADFTTYIKKMIEIDIIKYYIFSKEERNLISIIGNPDFCDVNQSHSLKKMIERTKSNERIFKGNLEENLKKIVNLSRNNPSTNKLVQMIQKGSNVIFENDE